MSLPPVVDVTAWYRFDKKNEAFDFNHLEDGHSAEVAPQDRQLGKRWKGGVWKKRVGTLVAGGMMGAPRLVLAEAPPAVATRDPEE